jgi:hypothetical protein
MSMNPLISDAGRPMRRALHSATLRIEDAERTQFELLIPAPAIVRHVDARVLSVPSPVVGGKPRTVFIPILTLEVDPQALPIKKRFYVLLYGKVASGLELAEWVFVGAANLPNGMPLAVYELPPGPPAPQS